VLYFLRFDSLKDSGFFSKNIPNPLEAGRDVC